MLRLPGCGEVLDRRGGGIWHGGAVHEGVLRTESMHVRQRIMCMFGLLVKTSTHLLEGMKRLKARAASGSAFVLPFLSCLCLWAFLFDLYFCL